MVLKNKVYNVHYKEDEIYKSHNVLPITEGDTHKIVLLDYFLESNDGYGNMYEIEFNIKGEDRVFMTTLGEERFNNIFYG